MLFKEENAYLQIANKIVDEGYKDKSRTGIDIRKIHCAHMEFNISNGKVPLLSTRKVPIKSPIIELLWFISGSTDIEFLKKHNVNIWDSWVIPGTHRYDNEVDVGLRELVKKGLIKPRDDLKSSEFFMKYGPSTVNQMLSDLTGENVPSRKLVGGSIGKGAYGAQWRNWEDIRVVADNKTDEIKRLHDLGYRAMFQDDEVDKTDCHNAYIKRYDQLQNCIDLIKNNPDSRRIVMSAWNAGKIDLCVLPPCHSFIQFLPFEKDGQKYLDISLTCRSQDFLVGTVFNIAQYAVLCHLVAHLTGRMSNKLYWTGNNTHIYENQVAIYQEEHRERSVLSNDITLMINTAFKDYLTIDDFTPKDLQITGYNDFLEPINYPVAV